MYWFKVVAPALCYYLFNVQFFRCAESVMDLKPLRIRQIIGTFLLNYSVFFACTLLEFHLILNWIIFLILLFTEQLLLYRQPARKCLLLSLLGTQLGLASNILFRSLTAIILNMPLVAFDNSTTDLGNMKVYPVLLGFLAAGLIFFLIARFHLFGKLNLLMENKATLAFLIGLLVAMYFYLCMNLAVYYIEENDLILKLWSMKSSIFVIMGECLSVILSIRMGQLSDYRAKNQESRESLAKEHLRELELRTIATTDPLTGCENCLSAGKRLQEALDKRCRFCLCFADLNGLKSVNDRFGHEMGDRYLLSVSEVLRKVCRPEDYLFRYGGDEFLLLLFDITEEDAGKLLWKAQKQLEIRGMNLKYPFSMSFSYGVATTEEAADASGIIQVADSRMYQMKLSKGQ